MEQDGSKYLNEARKQMVEHRRVIIKSLASAYDQEQMEAHITMLMKIQNAIDVIDRVSEDERARSNHEVERASVASRLTSLQTEHAGRSP